MDALDLDIACILSYVHVELRGDKVALTVAVRSIGGKT